MPPTSAPRVARYAPHPGAMSNDLWPTYMDDITQQLTSRKPLGGTSPYDDKTEAAAGAAAHVNAAFGRPVPVAPSSAFASASTSSGSASTSSSSQVVPGARKASLPTRPPPIMATPPARQWSGGWIKAVGGGRPPPVHTPPKTRSGSVGSGSPPLPTVILHPPDDEPGDPIPLYPRPNTDRAFIAPTGSARRIIESAPIPMPDDVHPRPQSMPGYSGVPDGGGGAGAGAGSLPMRREGFDDEWEALMGDLPDPQRQEQYAQQHAQQQQQQQQQQQREIPQAGSQKQPALYSQRRAPQPPQYKAPPAAQATPDPPQHDRRAARESTVPAQMTPEKKKRQTLPAKASYREEAAPPMPMPPMPTSSGNGAQAVTSSRGMHLKQASEPDEGGKSRRRSLSLSALWGRRKSKPPEEMPPVPPLPPVPQLPSILPAADGVQPPETPRTPQTPQTPSKQTQAARAETPTTDKKTKRRTLLGKGSLRDLFSRSQQDAATPDRKVRRSQSKPELRKVRVTPADAPPMPAMPTKPMPPMPSAVDVPSASAFASVPARSATPTLAERAASPTPRAVVPDALAALTARSTSDPAPAAKDPPVEIVADLFAAFGTSGANSGAPPPAPEIPDGPSPSSPASASVASLQKQMTAQVVAPPSPAFAQPSRPESPRPKSEKGAASTTPAGRGGYSKARDAVQQQQQLLQQAPPPPAKEEKRDRRKSLSKRLSLSSLSAVFKKKKPEEDAPEVPALPAGYERANAPMQRVISAPRSTPSPKTHPLPLPGDAHPPLPAARPLFPSQIQAQAEAQQKATTQQPTKPATPVRPALPFPGDSVHTAPFQFSQRQHTSSLPPSAPEPSTPRTTALLVSIKPPSPTKPLNIQKRVPVPSVNGSPPRKKVPPVEDKESKAVPATAAALAAAVTSPTSLTAATTAAPAASVEVPVRTPLAPIAVLTAAGGAAAATTVALKADKDKDKPKAPTSTPGGLSPASPSIPSPSQSPPPPPPKAESEETTLAYLDGQDSEEDNGNVSMQSNATASTCMPFFSDMTPPSASPYTSPSSTTRSRAESVREAAAAVVSPAASPAVSSSPQSSRQVDTPVETDPPSPSPSYMSYAEVFTAQTARRSKFTSLGSSEVLALDTETEEVITVGELKDVVTRGENSGSADSSVAAAGAALTGLGIFGAVEARDVVEDDARIEVLAKPEEEDEDDTAAENSPAFHEDLDSPILGSHSPANSNSPTPRTGSDDSHVTARPAPLAKMSLPASLPSSLSRATGGTVKPAPTVMEAIANTSIGLQPQQQPSSPLAEAIGEAEAVINDATSYIAQAASRVGRAATGLASAVTQALSPASTNAELPAEVPADSPISPAGSSIPRSPNVDLPNAEPYPLMSPSAASTATFDTAFESAEEGSIDSATFETFETLSTLSPSTSVYTPTIPPPQASLPDLSEHSPMRVRRGSMPASLSGTAARRRLASTPTGGLAADDDDDHIPRNLDRASPVMGPVPIRRPYTGRSATLPPPQATQVPLAALVTDPQRYEAMMVANGTLAGRFVGSPIPLSDMMSPVSIPADSRPDSPLDLQMPGTFSPLDLQMPGTFSPLALAASPFVVPFPADGEPELPSSPRSPTAVIDYSPTAAARERTRRDSGISSAVGGLGFARQGPIATVGGIPVSQTVTRGGAPVVYEQAPNRNSLPTVVDYSVRSPRGSIGAELALWSDVTGMTGMTGPQVLGADVDANTQAQACAPAEVTETLVDQHADVDPEESFQLDSSSCHSSSASDELDAAPCTPRTPELDHLANVTAGGVTPTQQRKSSASVVRESPPSAKTIRATGAPFRAMHYDMSQSSDDANDSFATANSNVL